MALVPMHVEVGDFERNYGEFVRRLDEAMAYSPDLVLFPEYCLTGFRTWDFSGAKLYDEIVRRVGTLVRERGIYVAFGLLEPDGECVYNSAVLMGRDGRVTLKHRKFQEPMRFCTGEELGAVDTEFGRVSLVICGDLYNDRILKGLLRVRPDYVLVPMEYTPEYGQLNEGDVRAMAERSRLFGAITFVANTFPPGGAWVFGRGGEVLAASEGDGLLIYEV